MFVFVYIYIYIFMSPCVSLLAAISRNYICSSNHGISIKHYTTMSYHSSIFLPTAGISWNRFHLQTSQLKKSSHLKLSCHGKAAVPRTAEHLSQIGNPAERCQHWLRISDPTRPGSLRHSSFGGTLVKVAFARPIMESRHGSPQKQT